MDAQPRRGPDWPTAWRALVPVYGLATILHAIFSLFAAPIWVIFFLYARMVLDGARLAEDPWRGRGSPRPYLVAFVIAIAAHIVAFALLPSTSSGSLLATATGGGVAALSLAAIFVAATAPPGARDARGLLRLGASAEILGALSVPMILFVASLPADVEAVGLVALPVVLAVVSTAAFLIASRPRAAASASVARKAPRE